MPGPKTPEETAYLEKIIDHTLWAVFRERAVDHDVAGGRLGSKDCAR
jgi:hypothetical protein